MLILAIILLVAIPVAYHVLTASRGGKHYPPGPKGLPLLGNIFDIPIDAAHITFARWCWTKYGGIMYLRILQKSVVVINSYSIARDLLEHRSALYACRPRVPMAGEVIGWSFSLPLVPYNDTFRRQRKYLQTYFAKQRLPNYYDLQRKQAYRLINAILDTPNLFNEHVHRVPAATIISIVYDHDAKTLDDWMLREIADGTKTLLATGAPGAHIVDLLPFLHHVPDWLPGASFKRLPPGTRESMHRMLHSPYNFVREQMSAGTAVPCYVSTMLEMTKYEDEQGIINTAATLYAAAFDTTIAVMMTAILLLTKYPHVQVKLQQEFERIVGKDRLPDFNDTDRLPYFHCVLEETLRFCSAVSMGVPHRNTEDDVYNGMFIPKGTTVLANIWAMLHDPAVYPNPAVFDPDRFMTGPGRTPAPSVYRIVFGFGRRRCPGEDFAMNSVYITIGILFHVFSFSQKTDDKGNLIPIDDSLTETTVRHPKPFVCEIKPRWPEAESLIRAVREDEAVSSAETK